MIPIVIVSYNRPKSLQRILNSLNRANIGPNVPLYISIDGGGHQDVITMARNFQWKHGQKEVIIHKQNLGLREHILTCGDLALQYDGIILLEDDLMISREFYNYVSDAVDFYKGHEEIAGISLYSNSYNETAQFPFIPLMDGYDVFFVQYPSSWGQCWTQKQWMSFRRWYGEHSGNQLENDGTIPENVLLWPESSWKKYFLKYMTVTGKYFVYPRISLSTNFCDPGEHFMQHESYLQVSLLYSEKKFHFALLSESLAVYDSYWEILPNKLKLLTKKLGRYDFTTDLYGLKNMQHVHSEFILTSKSCQSHIESYGLEMRPHELNIIESIPGSDLYLTSIQHVSDVPYLKKLEALHVGGSSNYYYNIRPFRKSPLQTLIPARLRNNESFFRISFKFYSFVKKAIRKLPIR